MPTKSSSHNTNPQLRSIPTNRTTTTPKPTTHLARPKSFAELLAQQNAITSSSSTNFLQDRIAPTTGAMAVRFSTASKEDRGGRKMHGSGRGRGVGGHHEDRDDHRQRRSIGMDGTGGFDSGRGGRGRGRGGSSRGGRGVSRGRGGSGGGGGGGGRGRGGDRGGRGGRGGRGSSRGRGARN